MSFLGKIVRHLVQAKKVRPKMCDVLANGVKSVTFRCDLHLLSGRVTRSPDH